MIFGISVVPALIRLVRAAVVTLALHWWNAHSGDTLSHYATGAAGMAVGKFLRDTFPGWFEWLPV